ncbi:DUF4403 family protein [Petrachloros mirabilis]
MTPKKWEPTKDQNPPNCQDALSQTQNTRIRLWKDIQPAIQAINSDKQDIYNSDPNQYYCKAEDASVMIVHQVQIILPVRPGLRTNTVYFILIPFFLILQAIIFPNGLVSPSILLAATDLTIPKPTDRLLPPPPAPMVEPSVVQMTVGRTLQEMRKAVESSIAVHHRHEVEWIPGKYRIHGLPYEYQYYIWRGPVGFKTDGGRLVTEFPDVRYRVRVRLKKPNGNTQIAECGYGPEAHMRMKLEAYSEVQWSEDWVVHTATSFGRPQFGEPCRLNPIGFDITELLDEWFAQRLPPLAAAIDHTFLKQAEAKNRARIIWEKFQEPMELRPGIWLTYHPQNPRAGSIQLNRDQSVQTSVSMVFDPVIVVGAKPKVDISALPKLQTGTMSQDGFHLAVPMLVPWEELTERVGQEAVGSEISPPVGSRIQVTGVQLYGSGNHLISEVTVTGGVNGKLYIQGRPSLTPDGATLEFRDFEFTVDTSNLLVKVTNRIMYDSIRDRVLPHTKIDLRDRIDVLRNRIEKQMNRELASGIWIQGEVTKLEPRAIYPVPGGMELQLVIDGTLDLIIQ